jgi:outer membrane lipoprotein SlyB
MSGPNCEPFTRAHRPRQALVAAAGLGLASIGLAAGLMLHAPPAPPEAASSTSVATSTSVPAHTSVARTGAETAPLPSREPAAPAERSRRVRTVSLCGDFGVIKGVRPVRRQGQGTGLGAVVGGVLGGVVGHPMGGGSGKTALILLGAVGGGVAGNEIEKRQRAETVYEMAVRMDDGSERRITQASPVVPGTRITVDRRWIHVAEQAQAHPSNRLGGSATGAS